MHYYYHTSMGTNIYFVTKPGASVIHFTFQRSQFYYIIQQGKLDSQLVLVGTCTYPLYLHVVPRNIGQRSSVLTWMKTFYSVTSKNKVNTYTPCTSSGVEQLRVCFSVIFLSLTIMVEYWHFKIDISTKTNS